MNKHEIGSYYPGKSRSSSRSLKNIIRTGLVTSFILGSVPSYQEDNSYENSRNFSYSEYQYENPGTVVLEKQKFGLKEGFDINAENIQKETRRIPFGYDLVLPLIKLSKTGSSIIFEDTSPTGISGDIKTWINKSINPHKELLNIAFYNGLNQIIIGQNYNSAPNSMYYIDEKKVFSDLDFSKPGLSAREFVLPLIHEVGHSLFSLSGLSDISRSENPVNSETAVFTRQSCSGVRKIALSEVEESIQVFNKIISVKRDPEENGWGIIYRYADQKKLSELDNQVENASSKFPECKFPSFIELRNSTDKYKNSFDYFEDFLDLQDALGEFLGNKSIYSIFTEQSYTNSNSGHPYHSIDETAASMLTTTILFPAEFGKKLKSVSDDKARAVLRMHSLFMNEFYSIDPRMPDYLRPKINKMYKAYFGK